MTMNKPLPHLGARDEPGGKIVFFDLETGGLNPEKHPIIQIAAIVVDADSLVELLSWECKVKFRIQDCDPDALAHNSYGKNPAAWDEAIPGNDAFQQFDRLIANNATMVRYSQKTGKPWRSCRLGGHNIAGFDVEFLNVAYGRRDKFKPYSFLVLDTMQEAQWWWERECRLCRNIGRTLRRPNSFKLVDLCAHFAVPLPAEEAHDALADVRATVGLAKVLMDS